MEVPGTSQWHLDVPLTINRRAIGMHLGVKAEHPKWIPFRAPVEHFDAPFIME